MRKRSRRLAPRRTWTRQELAELRNLYPVTDTAELARRFNCTDHAVYMQAAVAGLHKSEAYRERLREIEAERLLRFGAAHRFKKGLRPWNAGLKGYMAGGRSAETRFKKGQFSGRAARNYRPIGSLRINRDGLLDRKVRDDGPPQRRWVGVHRLVWIQHHGRIPKGHAVVFKPGRHTTDVSKITIDAIELVTRAELMRRNSYHTNYPKELARVIQLRGALTRQINRRERHAEQDQ